MLNRVTEDVHGVIVKSCRKNSGRQASELYACPVALTPSFPRSPADLSVAGQRDIGGITVQSLDPRLIGAFLWDCCK